MAGKRTSSYDDLVLELDSDPDFRVEFRKQKPFFDLIRSLVHLRRVKGITQQELARRAGMQQSTISRIESAEYDLRLSTLIRLAIALETNLAISFVSAQEEDAFKNLFNVTAVTPAESRTFQAEEFVSLSRVYEFVN